MTLFKQMLIRIIRCSCICRSGLLFRHQLSKRTAFTLAEVLITLAIIGIVAAIVLPGLITNIQDRHFKALWKKDFALISNAYSAAFTENPINVPTGLTSDSVMKEYARELYYQIFSRLTDDFCVSSTPYDHSCTTRRSNSPYKHSPDCAGLDEPRKMRSCSYAGSAGYAQLNNGGVIYAHHYIWTHPSFLIDVNGNNNGPNVMGRDLYTIRFLGNKILENSWKGCDKSIKSRPGVVASDDLSGSGCAFKYLYE